MWLRNIAWVLLGCALSIACNNESTGTGAADGGHSASDDGGSTSHGPALSAGTLLYIRARSSDSDVLVARTLATGEEHAITDLTGDGSSGWNISGYSLSPDRRRIALTSLYAPTSEDTATGLATRAVWTLDTDGTDFLRLTPTFPNDSGGRSNYSISVDGPVWTSDGAFVLYTVGTYWWEGTTLEGGATPWIVAASGSSYPTTWPTSFGCTVIHASRNPATGDMLLIHSVCVPSVGSGDGLYLYPADGGTSPTQLLAASRAADGIDVSLETPSWLADGSGFVFIGESSATDWRPAIFAYDMGSRAASLVFAPPADSVMGNAAIAPDASSIVYCLQNTTAGSRDLHLIDLSTSPPTDTALTHDGMSCSPSF